MNDTKDKQPVVGRRRKCLNCGKGSRTVLCRVCEKLQAAERASAIRVEADLRKQKAGREAAVESEHARDERGTRSQQRVGRRPMTWSEEPPRAGGWWWWWEGKEDIAPEIVKLTADYVTLWMYKCPTMQWPGLTRIRTVKAAGGWWCGPIEYTEPPLVERPPTDELSDCGRKP